MRATYDGGMSVAVGVLLFVLSSKRGSIENGLLGVIILMLCMASGRIYGIAVDGSANILMYIYLAIEIGMAGISWWALAHSGEKKEL
jgi:thiamine transporter ThiT